MSKKLVYLSCPYLHRNPRVVFSRYIKVTKTAGDLLKRGYNVYSPVSHNHIINTLCNLKWQHKDWMNYDFIFLDKCKKLFVLKLKGWNKSKGVLMEIERAKKLNIPIEYIKYKDYLWDK